MNTRIEEAISTIICLQKKNQEIVESINLELTNIAKANNVERNIGFFDNYEPDSSPLAWLYYTTVYQDMELPLNEDVSKGFFGYRKRFPNHCGFKKDCGTSNAKRIKYNYICFQDEEIWIGGDCAFNFKKEKIEFFKNIIIADDPLKVEKKELQSLLDSCQAMHYSVFNFNLMPVTGGLNNIKGRGHIDQFDVFIEKLQDYYNAKLDEKNYNHEIFTAPNTENTRAGLKHFLNKLGNIQNYCALFYNIDINEIYKNEKNENIKKWKSFYDPIKIENCESLLEYIELAVKFWKQQANHYDKCIEELSVKGDE